MLPISKTVYVAIRFIASGKCIDIFYFKFKIEILKEF